MSIKLFDNPNLVSDSIINLVTNHTPSLAPEADVPLEVKRSYLDMYQSVRIGRSTYCKIKEDYPHKRVFEFIH